MDLTKWLQSNKPQERKVERTVESIFSGIDVNNLFDADDRTDPVMRGQLLNEFEKAKGYVGEYLQSDKFRERNLNYSKQYASLNRFERLTKFLPTNKRVNEFKDNFENNFPSVGFSLERAESRGGALGTFYHNENHINLSPKLNDSEFSTPVGMATHEIAHSLYEPVRHGRKEILTPDGWNIPKSENIAPEGINIERQSSWGDEYQDYYFSDPEIPATVWQDRVVLHDIMEGIKNGDNEVLQLDGEEFKQLQDYLKGGYLKSPLFDDFTEEHYMLMDRLRERGFNSFNLQQNVDKETYIHLMNIIAQDNGSEGSNFINDQQLLT